MRKLFVEVCLVAVFACSVLGATECNTLLNCKTCADESHCESCPDGYKLDGNAVCRYDCASKFGKNCTLCTSEKCVCAEGTEWDSDLGKCVAVKDCSDSDPAACTYCGLGYDLIDMTGKCSTCQKVFGEGCAKCSESKCTEAKEGYVICGAIAVKDACPAEAECSTLFPGCTTCNDGKTSCTECSDKTEIVSGACKYKLPTCEAGQKAILVKDSFTCGTCQTFDENCIPSRCTGHGCTQCKTGFTTTAAGGCMNCSSKFTGCFGCVEYSCTRCRSSSWILTPNGCFNQNPYVPPVESKAGMIAGIVVGAFVLVVIVILAVYCICTAASKHGQVDPSLYEDDLQFKSVSVL